MNDHQREDEDVVRRLEEIATIEPQPAAIERAVARTRQAILAAPTVSASKRPRFLWSPSKRALRFAIVAGVLLALLLGGIGRFMFTGRSSSIAFAEVQASMRRLAFVKFTIKPAEGNKASGASGTEMGYFALDRGRMESADGRFVTVGDHNRGVMMRLDSSTHTAYRSEMPAAIKGRSFAEWFDVLGNGNVKGVERLPDAECEGRTVTTFRIPSHAIPGVAEEYVVLVDPKTHLPVHVDVQYRNPKGRLELHYVFTDFDYGPLDPSLFDMKVPPGYRVVKMDSSPPRPEKVVPVEGGPEWMGFELRLAGVEPGEGRVAATAPDSGEKLYLDLKPVITAADVESARVVLTQSTGKPALELRFTDAAAERLERATSANIKKRLAVLVEGKVIASPLIVTPISQSAKITGDFTLDEVKAIARGLSAGKEGK